MVITASLRDVSFRYPGSDTYALRHVTIKIGSGEHLAVVGRSGSGKTTFIKLLCRFYDVTEGEILLNGIPVQAYSKESLTQMFSVVFQDFTIFPCSVAQNVSCGAGDEDRIHSSLEKAGLLHRVERMPKGIFTTIYQDLDERGVEISGGEAQKLALARALYKDAPIIVLDEPTASLDPVAEYEVYKKFSHISEKKTAVFISHKLSSCKFCERIAVFCKGELVQCGSHNELILDNKGSYAELWNAQAVYYMENP